ncbi:hypothetical protein [Litoreibacter halocynthiae]|uniref:hypothetical protein n=1 Tax=Litoreibacter halocynthiae TaxID=1242689 RepID=UPI0013C2B8DB|nr:hypothetical protein [Litoreibacter halocynthiae]
MFPFLLIYIGLSPGLGAMLIANEAALARFMRQVLTNGIMMVFAINYVGFFAFSHFQRQGKGNSLRHLLADVLSRSLLFVALHAIIYVMSADLFASFGGNRKAALQVIGPTLERAFFFKNLSGVYLYSALPGAFVCYLALLQGRRALVATLGFCAAFVFVVTLLSVGSTQLLGRP